MKKTLVALTLATVMLFGSTASFAGIIISDKAEPSTCDATESKNDGIIIFGRDGIIIFGYAIIGSKEPSKCEQNEGIIISDSPGIIISD